MLGFSIQDRRILGEKVKIIIFHLLSDASSTYPTITSGTISKLLIHFNASTKSLQMFEKSDSLMDETSTTYKGCSLINASLLMCRAT